MPRIGRLSNWLAFAALVLASTPLLGDGSSKSDAEFAGAIFDLTDLILQRHIDPPTRQQMILAGSKALYRAEGRRVPQQLGKRLSKLSRRDEIIDYLESLVEEFHNLTDPQNTFVHELLASLPGEGRLIPAKDARVQEQLAANRYVGIGIALAMDEDLPYVARVIYQGPAWEAGLKAEDRILKINGKTTKGQNLRQYLDQLRGEKGSQVNLSVAQPKEEQREISIVRDVTFIPTVLGHEQVSDGHWRYTIASAPNLALIKIATIGPSTLHELRKIEVTLRTKDIKGLVLDLRGGGGLLHDTIMLADQLLDGGTIGYVQSVDSVVKHEASPGGLFQNIPMAVLIDPSAGTDRVFLTAALQDHNRAIVIGEPNSGNTYVNSLVTLSSGDRIRIAVGLLQRADGTTLLQTDSMRTNRQLLPSRVGSRAQTLPKHSSPVIIPDHVVRFRMPADLRQDPLLEKAIEILSPSDAQASIENGPDRAS